MRFDSRPSRFPNLLGAFFDLLGPTCCVGCTRRLASRRPPLCADCLRSLPWWRYEDGCPRCGFDPLPHIAGSDGPPVRRSVCPGCLSEGAALHTCHAALRYEGAVRSWIPQFKRVTGPFGPSGETRRAIDFLTQELVRELAGQIASAGRDAPDLIVPIPLHPRRQRVRGFNHCDPVARALAHWLGRPWQRDALVRARPTPPQAALRGEARRRNVLGAFRATLRGGSPERVWIVDDVLTTGATLEAAANALLDAGVEEVHGICLAATRPRRRLATATITSALTSSARAEEA